MPVRVACSCGRSLNLADNLRGKRVKCPECGSAISVPSPERNAAPAKTAQTGSTGPSQPRRSAAKATTGRTSSARRNSKSGVSKTRPPQESPVPEDDDLGTDWMDEPDDSSWNQSVLPPRKNTHSANSAVKSAGRKKSPLVMILLISGIGLVLVGGVAIIAIAAVVRGISNSRTDNVPLPNVASVKIPESVLPARPTFQPTFGSGIQLARTRLTGNGPGESTQLNIYLPAGAHAEKSLGCVLVAPAGTNLLVGNSLDGDDYHDETLPYAEAGFMTIQYSLDGPVPDLETASDSQFSAAYKQFKAAGAGTLNTRAVIDFVKARLPEVDSARIYTAGHSSAGTVSLLAAEYFPEIAGCIAYAPCSDTEAFHAEISGTWGIDRLLPGIKEFDRQYSPVANVQKLKCPLFVFQARDDSVVEVAETKRFVEKAKAINQQVEYVEVANGEHYDSMISQGIPRAITWLKKIDSK